LLHKKAAHDPALNDIAATIRAEASSSAAMVNRFLTFARPLSLMEDAIDLTRFLAECRDKGMVAANRKSVKIEMESPARTATIMGDPLLLKEALGNVIDNAVQAVDIGGRVVIRLELHGDRAEISVIDDGPGIPEKLRDKIFTPFISSKPSGTGLGLALTRKIINLHGGSIGFDPVAEPGSVCRISLPLAVGEEDSQPAIISVTGKNQ
jgi:signal transduction histidine kinase